MSPDCTKWVYKWNLSL